MAFQTLILLAPASARFSPQPEAVTRTLAFAVNPDADEGGPIYIMGRPLTVQVREREREEMERARDRKKRDRERDKQIQFSETCTLDI